MDDINIRSATSLDVPRITELGKELGDVHRELGGKDHSGDDFWAPPSASDPTEFARLLEEHISKDDSIVLVTEEGERIISYCWAAIESMQPEYGSKTYGSIYELMVADFHRGQGIGRGIVQEVEKWFRSKDIYVIQVGVAAFNEKGALFWEKMGYSPGLVLRNKTI